MSIKKTIDRERLRRKSDAISKTNEELWVTNRKALMALGLEKDLLRFTELVTSEPVKIKKLLKRIDDYKKSLFNILGEISSEM